MTTTLAPPRRSTSSRIARSRSASAAGSLALIITSTCASRLRKQASQCSGALSPTSPSSSAREAMPSRNSAGKPASESSPTPSARSPSQLNARLMPESGLTSQRSAVMTSAIVSLRKARAFTASSMRRNR